MASNEGERAQQLLEAALGEAGVTDPREGCRERLRELKEREGTAYQEAVRHFEEILVPAIASGSEDPLAAWREYALQLAKLTAPGRTVTIDASGLAGPYRPDSPADHLVLHVPTDQGGRPIPVALPSVPTEAQSATFDWLVVGRKKLANRSQ